MLFRDVISKLLVTLEHLEARILQALMTAYIIDMRRHIRRVSPVRFSTEAKIVVVLSTTVNVGELTVYMFSCMLYVLFAGTMK
jgi:hypothetical protein